MRTALTIGLVLLFVALQAQSISEWHTFRGGGGGAYVETIKRYEKNTALWFDSKSDSVLLDSNTFLYLTPTPPPSNIWQSEQAYFVLLDSARQLYIKLQFSAGKSIRPISVERTRNDDFLLTYMISDDTIYLNNTIFIADTTIKKGALCLTKVRPNGEIAFTRYFPCSSALSAHIAILANQNIVLAGYVNYSDITFDDYTLHCLGCHVEDTDIFVALFDSNGQTLNARRFGSTQYDYCNDLMAAHDGNLYISGTTLGDFSYDSLFFDNYLSWLSGDAFLLKLDSDLNAIWLLQAGSTDEDAGRVLIQDNAGDFYWACQFWGNIAFFAGDTLTGNSSNTFIAKINNDGQVLWKKVFAGEGPVQYISSLAIDSVNNIWATMGYFGSLAFDDVTLPGGIPSASGSIRSDAALIQLDQTGEVLQYYVANSAATESFSGVQVLSGNQLFVSGSANIDDGDSLQFLNMTLHDWPGFSDPSFYFILDLPLVSTETPPDTQGEVSLMPNPVKKGGLLQVRTEGALQGGLVLLYDNLGRPIWSGRMPDGAKQFSLPAPSLTGLYYLSIQTNNQLCVKKVVVAE
ncbi:MAG: T9SS C-terminal target domain-containing protein [Haliscomenobacteraceae bacterium CHB4]|nr:hypothetical protein [Saprospiraceae bacterium]MCE7923228.1 T9SS C-terminal target domain-containing protein [Haliscomenobacteraceae bacterium CHB4]